jgi:outer membrane protein assembly factor BamA
LKSAIFVALAACVARPSAHPSIAPPGTPACSAVPTPNERVRAVDIEGVSREQLAALAILEGTLYDDVRLQRLATAAGQWWRKQGYPHAEVTAKASRHCASEGVVVHVTASLGRRYTLSRLDVIGSAVPAPATSFEREFGTYNRVGAAYREDLFAEDLNELMHRHQNAGYYDATFKITSHVDERHTVVYASARVVPGQRYKLVRVSVDGGTPEERALIERVYAVMRGRWYDRDTVSMLSTLDATLEDTGILQRTTPINFGDGTAGYAITLEDVAP